MEQYPKKPKEEELKLIKMAGGDLFLHDPKVIASLVEYMGDSYCLVIWTHSCASGQVLNFVPKDTKGLKETLEEHRRNPTGFNPKIIACYDSVQLLSRINHYS